MKLSAILAAIALAVRNCVGVSFLAVVLCILDLSSSDLLYIVIS
jgi:hypothetical protein